MREKIRDIVFEVVREFNQESSDLIDLKLGEKTRLFGGGGALSSLGLVSFVVMVEEAIEAEFDRPIVLADERAMSRRVSPFASIGTLIDYIEESLLQP
jgi:acyl carrier protein